MTPLDPFPPSAADRGDPPLWLFPNLFGLDAPLVAVVWQVFLARSFGVPLPPAAAVGLFATVWLVYLIDRVLDARRVDDGHADRHRFAARRRGLLLALAAVALVVAVTSAALLPAIDLWVGGGVAVVVGLYMLAVHRLRHGWLRDGGKELAVGVVFAAGVSVPLVVDGRSWAWAPAVAAFGLLCWWNCRLIDRWEVRPTESRTVGRVIGLGAVAAGWFAPWPVGAAVSSAAVLLLVVDLTVPRIGTRAGRVLADAVLLTPFAVWAFT